MATQLAASKRQDAATVTPQLTLSLVTETYPPEINGVAMTLSRFVTGLQQRGHRLHLVRPRQPATAPAADTDPPTLTVGGLHLPLYPDLQLGLPAGRRIRRAWESLRPDIVYIATEGPLGWSALNAARVLDIPVVTGFHTNFHSYSGHYHLGLLMPLVKRYLRHFHRRGRCTLAPSPEVCEALSADGFGRMQVLPRGVDTALFDPARRSPELRRQWGLEEADMAVLYVGRVAAEKNIHEALAAFRRIQQRRPEARFIIVGDGPLRTTLARAHPDLIFCGMQTGTALAAHFASADLFLFPSRTETFGNVTLEAMASGLPVVAYDYAAAAMHIRDGSNGVRVALDRPGEFACRAEQLAAWEPRRLSTLGQAARAHTEGLGWDRVVERFESILYETAFQEPAVHASCV